MKPIAKGHGVAVTMRQVAASAGVSVATVSRALAGRAPVSEATRRAIEEASERLGYRPDPLAAALRTGSSGSVGMLIPDISSPFFPSVVQSVEHELARAGIDLLFCDAENDVAAETRRIEMLLRRRVDALLVCPVDSTASAPSLRAAARHVRVLQFERSAINEADFVGVDQSAGMTQVAEHLATLGVEDAVFVGRQSKISSIVERASAFEAACRAVRIRTGPIFDVFQPDVAAGRAFIADAIAASRIPSAIVCANDPVAFGVLAGLRAAGLSCPGDALVVGYDDVPAAELVGLTTVRQPLGDLGREAARMLQHPSDAPRHVRFTPRLMIRASTVATGDLVAHDSVWLPG